MTIISTSALAERLKQPKALLAPGVYDAFSALIAEQAGFEALYLSGASIAYTRLGRSDIGLTTATEVAQTLAHITPQAHRATAFLQRQAFVHGHPLAHRGQVHRWQVGK